MSGTINVPAAIDCAANSISSSPFSHHATDDVLTRLSAYSLKNLITVTYNKSSTSSFGDPRKGNQGVIVNYTSTGDSTLLWTVDDLVTREDMPYTGLPADKLLTSRRSMTYSAIIFSVVKQDHSNQN